MEEGDATWQVLKELAAKLDRVREQGRKS
jgi:hypothetical protein